MPNYKIICQQAENKTTFFGCLIECQNRLCLKEIISTASLFAICLHFTGFGHIVSPRAPWYNLKKGEDIHLNWLYRFMSGRYGMDPLNVALLVVGLLLAGCLSFTHIWWLFSLGYLPCFYAMYRMFSRNIVMRSRENQWFLRWWTPLSSRIRRFIDRKRDKTHRYFKCPKCHAVLRVPKGKGRICIICTKCRHEFIKKTWQEGSIVLSNPLVPLRNAWKSGLLFHCAF